MTPRQLEPRTVYFIRPIGMQGPVKIGCSKSPEGRRDTLATWAPFPLEIVAKLDGNYAIERRFHALFLTSHERREWFGWTPEMEAVIASINAGTFDISTLPEPVCVASRNNGNRRKRTPEQCQQFSLSIRESYRRCKTGYSCPVEVSRVVYRGDPDELAAVEQWLADPASNGIPIAAPWAKEARELYHANGQGKRRAYARRSKAA